jgi:hypothetical protein
MYTHSTFMYMLGIAWETPHLAELLRSQTSVDECIDLLASTEDHAWERSPDTGRRKSSNPVQWLG